MLGQAATARSATTTVAALHTAVTEGATAQLTARAEQFPTPEADQDRHQGPEAEPLDIAIVGMACCYPGAADAARFWSNIVAGCRLRHRGPRRALGHRYVPRPGPRAGGRTHPVALGRLPARRPSTPSPTASRKPPRRHRAGTAARPGSGRQGPGGRRIRRARLRPRPHQRRLRRRGGHRTGGRLRPARPAPGLPGRPAARARRRTAAPDRGLLPRRPRQRHRRTHREPPRPGRRQLHRGRRLRLLARRPRPGVPSTARP